MDIQLRLIKKPEITSDIFLADTFLKKEATSITIGRDSHCDIQLPCPQKIISRIHTRIEKNSSGTYQLTDLSANGTYINKQPQSIGQAQSVTLTNDDIIHIGDYSLQFSSSTPAPSPQAPIEKKATKPAAKPLQKELGELSDQITTPKVNIPDNWNTPVNLTSNEPKKVLPSRLQQSLSETDSKQLLSSLLKGLGIEDTNNFQSISSENMLALGRTVRCALTGIQKQQEQTNRIKAKLCFGEKELLNIAQSKPLAEKTSPAEILEELLYGNTKTTSDLPFNVINAQKELMEDQAAIFNSFNTAIDSFRETLSPFAIETLYNHNPGALPQKLVPSLGKWETYKREWGKRCISFKTTIQKHFSDNIRLLHQKRLQNKSSKK